MSEPTAQRHSSSHAIRSATASALTEVEVTWIEKRYEQWIRFGRIAADTIINRRTRVIAFRPGAVFAFVRWTSNDYGTIHSCIDIVTAVAPGEAYTTLPFVRPGAEILLHIEGWPKVAQVLQAIDAVDVRRQNIWHNSRRRLAECGPRQGVDVRRRACGAASADVRWSVA